MKHRICHLLAIVAPILLASASSARAHVDLHAHPFMDDGLGSLFRGRFEDENLRAKNWRALLDSQINQRTLNDSELKLVVVSIYVHPLINAPKRKMVRSQLDRAEAFVKANPQWVIARTALQAKEARKAGKRVIIFALEGASGTLETEEDLQEFIDERGIRIVTFLHLTDDHLGGAAFFASFKGWIMQPISWLTQLFSPLRDETGAKLNKNGLSDDGMALARKLIARGVWIDLAHSSDESQRALIPMLKEAGQPLLYTHTLLRRHDHIERAISDSQLEQVRTTGGIVGLMPSETLLEATPARCEDGIHRLATQFTEVSARIGAASTVIGSDFNGGITHLAPPVCQTGTDFDAEGVWHIGQTGRLWRAVAKLGAPAPSSSEDYVSTFLTAWGRVSQREKLARP